MRSYYICVAIVFLGCSVDMYSVRGHRKRIFAKEELSLLESMIQHARVYTQKVGQSTALLWRTVNNRAARGVMSTKNGIICVKNSSFMQAVGQTTSKIVHLPGTMASGLKNVVKFCARNVRNHPKTVIAIGTVVGAFLAGRFIASKVAIKREENARRLRQQQEEEQERVRRQQEEERRRAWLRLRQAGGNMECRICLDQKDIADCCALECGHAYCKDCLSHILDGAIAAHSTATLRCPTPGCRSIDVEDVRKITRDRAKRDQLQTIQLDEFLAAQPNARHCPTPNCPYSFINEDRERRTFDCPRCLQRYCPQCLLNHPGITCDVARANQRLSGDKVAAERATLKFIQKDSKNCPTCHASIYRTEGCNHMTCRCGYQFCWVCMTRWPGYNRHACPTFGEPNFLVRFYGYASRLLARS